MALTKEQKELVSIANQLEKMQQTVGWKSFKKVWDQMYLDILGGVDKKGNIIDGAISDTKCKDDFEYHLGYRRALAELWERGINDVISTRNAILEQLKEEEDTSNIPVNPMEREPGEVPHL